jgi:high-affinity iron transporter
MFAVTTLVCGLVLTAVTPAAAAHVRGQRITVTTTTCAPRWHAPNPGRAHFAIVNHSGHAATVYLFHPVSGTIVATVRDVKAGTTRALAVHLKRGGHYIWGCDVDGRPPRDSDAEVVPLDPNHGGTGPPVVPVTRDELAGPMKTYRHYVDNELRVLRSQVTTLGADLHSDDVSGAKSAWLAAHLSWLRIGQDDGAYSAFGTLGSAIDGTTAGLKGGTSSPSFTGFHKVEFDLWTRGGVAAASADTVHLGGLLTRLAKIGMAKELPLTTASVSGLPLRCHEILEDALRDSLSGEDDYGSGTSLASIRADVSGVRELLGLLAPLIAPRSPHLVHRARRSLSRLDVAVGATRRDGRWVPVSDLARSRREAVDGRTGAALEILAPVPDLLTIGKS